MILSNLVGRIVHSIFSTMAHNTDALRTHLQINPAFFKFGANVWHEFICINGILPKADGESETLTNAHTIGFTRKHSMDQVQQRAPARDYVKCGRVTASEYLMSLWV